MLRFITVTTLAFSVSFASAQNALPSPVVASSAFDVATIRPTNPNEKGRFITMQGTHRFIAQAYTLKLLIAAAYDLNPKTISGGPDWGENDHFDITAITPGDSTAKYPPSRDLQMAMLRTLLTDRFKLTFHREQKVFSIYELTVLKSGAKLKPSTAAPDDPSQLISTVYPDRIHLPARNATMADFASLLQRAILDRPVVNSTDLTGRFDFDLDWTPDESQFGGAFPPAKQDAPIAQLFTALQEQLGLHIEATRGPVSALVIDHADHPTVD